MTTAAIGDRAADGDEDDEAVDVTDLVWRLKNGERSALAEAYDRHHESVRAFARRLLGDPTAAEDLVHDVFIALPRAIRRFEGRSSLATFLKSIAINLCRRHVRSAARYRRARERWSEEPPNEATTADDRSERAQMAELLARALDRLPVDQRVAFVLCAIEERTSAEAAALVGVPEVTMRTRVHRAKVRLRELLAAQERR